MADLIEREPLLEKMFPSQQKRLVEEAPAVNRWIPCSERLPETGVDVIVYWQGSLIKIAHLMHDYLWETSDGEYDLPAKDVTHWMPLPEPPEVNENA